MKDRPQTEVKKVCEYCHTYIKDKEDMLICPQCSAVYHIDCWYENEGCAAYGCNYKVSIDTKKAVRHFSINDTLVDIEYSINCKNYTEALSLCRQILMIDNRNVEAKKFYNRIVSQINAKIKLIQSGDKSFDEGDLKSATAYYQEALNFSDEAESGVLRSKLQIINEKYASFLKRKRNIRILINSLLVTIVLILAFLVYYTIFLKEARDYNEIEKTDNVESIENMSNQVSKYEQFLIKYKDGNYYSKAKQKINYFSYALANAFLPLNFKSAYKYFQKIDTAYSIGNISELAGKISLKYESEFKDLLKNARDKNLKGEFSSAKDYLEKAIALIDISPKFVKKEDISKLNSYINLLNKKNSSMIKLKNIQDEMKQKTDEIEDLTKISDKKTYTFNIQIWQVKNPTTYIAENIDTKQLLALKSESISYVQGDYDNVKCIKTGNLKYIHPGGAETRLTLYESINRKDGLLYDEIYVKAQREALTERLSYLRMQKIAIDSILKINF